MTALGCLDRGGARLLTSHYRHQLYADRDRAGSAKVETSSCHLPQDDDARLRVCLAIDDGTKGRPGGTRASEDHLRVPLHPGRGCAVSGVQPTISSDTRSCKSSVLSARTVAGALCDVCLANRVILPVHAVHTHAQRCAEAGWCQRKIRRRSACRSTKRVVTRRL